MTPSARLAQDASARVAYAGSASAERRPASGLVRLLLQRIVKWLELDFSAISS